MKNIPAEYLAHIGKWATIQSRHQTALNGRQCRIIGVQRVGKSGALYYRVNCISGGPHPATERGYPVGDLVL